VSNYTGANRYNTFLIGDLDEEEAKNFWELLLKCSDYDNCFPLPDFPLIYSICRGNMLVMESALKYWDSEMRVHGEINWDHFPFILQESNRLHKACFDPSAIMVKSKSKPRWTRDDLLLWKNWSIQMAFCSIETYVMSLEKILLIHLLNTILFICGPQCVAPMICPLDAIRMAYLLSHHNLLVALLPWRSSCLQTN